MSDELDSDVAGVDEAGPVAPIYVPAHKIERRHMRLLCVEGDACPLLLTRVLDLAAAEGGIAFTITFRRHRSGQSIEVETAVVSERDARSMLDRLRQVDVVRGAYLKNLDDVSATSMRAKF